ncbi:Protein N-terminal and lysine N-methyltransferase efm7 [Coemansia guatemalensis]|uniref:Protein N-terminal and lysine N-methyltransferase EFM7 n=1 Tax=Coemansia guatemalensis TaxID=2761395 RepID=A0A9W8LV69_9FUNG|nr:Protein N-terminal and lysine N-methyltransferase efm7 [Coemansia guatemalensis]
MSSSMDDQDDFGLESMLQEPADFRPPPPEGRIETFERKCAAAGATSIRVSLLGSHPLWGHHLWNAAKEFANYLDKNPELVANKSVLELGAAGALPSLVAALNGAHRVVITDYPDPDLLANIRRNVELNMPERLADGSVTVAGYRWGSEIERIAALSGTSPGTFDVLILCDLVFNHTEHLKLLESVCRLMSKPNGVAFVFFTHHRPWLAEKDMEFITRAHDEMDLDVTRVAEIHTGVMFPEDPGDEQVRGTVHGFRFSHKTDPADS